MWAARGGKCGRNSLRRQKYLNVGVRRLGGRAESAGRENGGKRRSSGEYSMRMAGKNCPASQNCRSLKFIL